MTTVEIKKSELMDALFPHLNIELVSLVDLDETPDDNIVPADKTVIKGSYDYAYAVQRKYAELDEEKAKVENNLITTPFRFDGPKNIICQVSVSAPVIGTFLETQAIFNADKGNVFHFSYMNEDITIVNLVHNKDDYDDMAAYFNTLYSWLQEKYSTALEDYEEN